MEHSLEEILHAEKQLQQAMLKNDVQVLERLLHADLLFTDQTGQVIGKQEDIASHASNELQLTKLEFIEPPIIHVYGETAIVVVKADLKGTFQGTPFAGFYRYLRVWIFQEECWQIVAGNLCTIA